MRKVSSGQGERGHLTEALVITGLYGSGKTTLAAQIGDLLEDMGLRYATIDLDWLGWYEDHRPRPEGDWSMMQRNLAAVVANYRDLEIDHFVLARALQGFEDVELLVETLKMPVRTVELVVPIEVIERRLASDPTTGRRNDLDQARRWAADSTGTGFADLVVSNDRPILEVANEVIDWWISGHS